MGDSSPVYAEITCDAIVNNIESIRSIIGDTEMMAIIKADGYGHGAVTVARIAQGLGVKRFGVARLCEALALRHAGITEDILILGYTPPEQCDYLVYNNITQTIFSEEYAKELSFGIGHLGKNLKAHLKIDTGMGRIGIPPCLDESGNRIEVEENGYFLKTCRAIRKCSNITIEGCYMHFESSDSTDKSSAEKQLSLFKRTLSLLKDDGCNPPLCHAANSAAILSMPDSLFNMVRPGIILYGQNPSKEIGRKEPVLIPAMTIKAKIAMIKNVPAQFPVSYGHTYITKKPSTLATIPIGYADGYNRLLSSKGNMLVAGQLAPVVGRVCMDQTILDITGIPGVKAGDEVVILGRQGGLEITATDIADQVGTINYEVVSTLMSRVPRILIKK